MGDRRRSRGRGDDSPEAEAAAVETAARLNALISALPGPQREAVAMRKEAELTNREIARVSNQPRLPVRPGMG